MRRNRSTAFILLAAMAGTAAFAGTTVIGPEKNVFLSPMVLETDFALTSQAQWDRKQWHEAVPYRDLGQYLCEDISITYFARDVQTGTDRTVRVKLKGRLRNSGGRDKDASVHVEMVKGDRVIARGDEKKIEVEEGDDARFGISFQVPVLEVTSAPEPRFRITLTVDD